MPKLNVFKWDNLIRGDSAGVAWKVSYRDSSGDLHPKSLVGYTAALTLKPTEYDNSVTDVISDEKGRKAAEGFEGQLAICNVDCDVPEEMHYIDPAEGRILFDLHKQAMWLNPGTYYMDIVLENKSSHRTHTYVMAKVEVQGHPTNRLTTDTPDTFDDVRNPESI